jgi:diguanylate cyclase (GGDEF)-like protein
LTPGAISEGVAFCSALVVMAGIFVAGLSSGFSVRFFVLYVLPLAWIGLHCGRYLLYFAAVGIALIFEGLALAAFRIDSTVLVANVLIEGVVAGAIVFVAAVARANYLKALRMAWTDHLTDLANNRAFESIASLEIARLKRYGGVFSIAILDLDGFKQLNDTRGHRVGDEALKRFAHVLRSHTRESDTVARIGGDEFAILMPNTHLPDCRSLCDQFRNTVMQRMSHDDFDVTVSIGSATFDQAPDSVASAMERADGALYSAKKSGKNCVVCC